MSAIALEDRTTTTRGRLHCLRRATTIADSPVVLPPRALSSNVRSRMLRGRDAVATGEAQHVLGGEVVDRRRLSRQLHTTHPARARVPERHLLQSHAPVSARSRARWSDDQADRRICRRSGLSDGLGVPPSRPDFRETDLRLWHQQFTCLFSTWILGSETICIRWLRGVHTVVGTVDDVVGPRSSVP